MKVQWIYDHVKPTIKDVSPEDNILLVGKNDLNSEKNSSQIARSITELPVSLKADANIITIS